MKLCIDCKHFTVPTNHTPESGLCKALEGHRSLVTGIMLYPHTFASAHRISGCGEEAKLFKPKEATHDKP